MRVLGIETATDLCCVGLADGADLIAEYRLHRRYAHAERLPEAVNRLVDDSGFRLTDLDAVAVSIGPGSFTGLRIGLGFAKGLALGLKKPLAAVPTMDGIMLAVPPLCPLACVLLIARKGEMYRSVYRWKEDRWEASEGIDIVTEERIVQDLPESSVVFIGEGSVVYRECIRRRFSQARFFPVYYSTPSGVTIAVKGAEMLEKGETTDLGSLTPMYIKRFQGID